jgi:hypothetical protein
MVRESPYDDRVTARRALGAGPQAPHSIRAVRAGLVDALPGVRLPDVEGLRACGVLGVHAVAPSAPRRTLGSGACADEVPSPADWCGVAVVAESSSSARGCDCLAYRSGNAVDRPQCRPRFGSDMSDAGWPW